MVVSLLPSPAPQRGPRGSMPESTKPAHFPRFPLSLGCAGALLSPEPAHRARYPPRWRTVQAKPEKSERKVLAIPSIVEQVKAASPAKAEYGLDYYGNFVPTIAPAVLSGLCAGDAGASTLRIAPSTFDAAGIAIGATAPATVGRSSRRRIEAATTFSVHFLSFFRSISIIKWSLVPGRRTIRLLVLGYARRL